MAFTLLQGLANVIYKSQGVINLILVSNVWSQFPFPSSESIGTTFAVFEIFVTECHFPPDFSVYTKFSLFLKF